MAPATVDHDVVVFILGAEEGAGMGPGGWHPARCPAPSPHPDNRVLSQSPSSPTHPSISLLFVFQPLRSRSPAFSPDHCLGSNLNVSPQPLGLPPSPPLSASTRIPHPLSHSTSSPAPSGVSAAWVLQHNVLTTGCGLSPLLLVLDSVLPKVGFPEPQFSDSCSVKLLGYDCQPAPLPVITTNLFSRTPPELYLCHCVWFSTTTHALPATPAQVFRDRCLTQPPEVSLHVLPHVSPLSSQLPVYPDPPAGLPGFSS